MSNSSLALLLIPPSSSLTGSMAKKSCLQQINPENSNSKTIRGLTRTAEPALLVAAFSLLASVNKLLHLIFKRCRPTSQIWPHWSYPLPQKDGGRERERERLACLRACLPIYIYFYLLLLVGVGGKRGESKQQGSNIYLHVSDGEEGGGQCGQMVSLFMCFYEVRRASSWPH